MKLTIRHTAELLGVAEKTIYLWIKRDKLPASRINDLYILNKMQVMEWAMARHMRVPASFFIQKQPEEASWTLEETLRTGGVHRCAGGVAKASALKFVVEAMPLPPEIDRTFMLQVLVARESLGTTGIGNGIAIPHVRNPILLHVPHPILALCFLADPIEFGSLDGKPVNTLFTIVSPTVTAHLSLLSRLAFALQQPFFEETIKRQASEGDIFSATRQIDQLIPENKSNTTQAKQT